MSTTIDQIRSLLAQKAPLTITSTREVYDALRPQINNLLYHTVREAVQKISLGSETAKRRNTPKYYAIYLTVTELKAATGREDIILSLPGIDREYIQHMGTSNIKAVKARLSSIYSAEVVNYWVQKTQLRSVDEIKESQRKAVIERDNKRCRICEHIQDAFRQRGFTIPSTLQWVAQPAEKPRVSHIISRSATFWHLLDHVRFQQGLDVFTPQGVVTFRQLLVNSDIHSSAQYMVYLCRKHDKLVQQALKV